jgi:chaperone modulatory protein CbpM
MIGLADLLQTVQGLERAEIERWVAMGWVMPDRAAGELRFTQVDIARVRLIAEIHRDCAVDEETMPVVLGLLDQVYTLRRGLKEILEILAEQPADVREAVAAALSRRHDGETAAEQGHGPAGRTPHR